MLHEQLAQIYKWKYLQQDKRQLWFRNAAFFQNVYVCKDVVCLTVCLQYICITILKTYLTLKWMFHDFPTNFDSFSFFFLSFHLSISVSFFFSLPSFPPPLPHSLPSLTPAQLRGQVGPCRCHVTRSIQPLCPREPSKRTRATLTAMAASSM